MSRTLRRGFSPNWEWVYQRKVRDGKTCRSNCPACRSGVYHRLDNKQRRRRDRREILFDQLAG